MCYPWHQILEMSVTFSQLKMVVWYTRFFLDLSVVFQLNPFFYACLWAMSNSSCQVFQSSSDFRSLLEFLEHVSIQVRVSLYHKRKCWFQLWTAYSKCGITSTIYNFFQSEGIDLPWKVLFKSPSILLDFNWRNL